MAGALPPRIPLANLPTPLEPLVRIGAELGLDLWIKRDDLTGSALTGNKVRKLEYLAADALEQGADTLITCGAVTSNHARATAVAAARLGLGAHLVLRGGSPDTPDGNLLLSRVLGAGVTFITHAQWSERTAIMERIAADLSASGRSGYAIPEGGSNHIGAMGYVAGVTELLQQADELAVKVRRIVHATGSGGTTAGLALGCAKAGRADIDVIGVAVCDDAAYFDGVIWRILDEAVTAGFATEAQRRAARWRILEGYKGEGYARTTEAEMETLAHLARTEGVFVDPVYTGKAFCALIAEAHAGRIGDGATVFLHTGGIFGLFSFADEINRL